MNNLSWEEAFLLAQSYYELNGNLIVNNNYITESGYNLGNWIYNQRRAYKRNELSKKRIDLLNDIGMVWDAFDNNWKIMYKDAKKIYITCGFIDIYKIDDKLSIWLKKQEKLYLNNELIDWKKDLLDQINIKNNFSCTTNLKCSWDDIYKLAVKFYEDNNNLVIPRSYVSKLNNTTVKLGKWINTQRCNYNNGKLDEDKIDKLNKIGMVWKIRSKREALEWDKWYGFAKEYYNIYGNLKVLNNYLAESKYKLSSWIRKQRTKKNNNKLTDEQIKQLNDIGMEWDIHSYTSKSDDKKIVEWDKMYLLALDYYEKNGDIFVPEDYVDENGFALGKWISAQKRHKKANTLTYEQITKLEDIGIIWNSYNTITKVSWNEAFEYAKEYYLENGDLLIKREYLTDDGYKLGRWINTQRTYKSRGKLSNEKIKQLDSIGMIWVVNPEQEKIDWLVAYECAKKYYEYYNNLSIDALFKTDESYPKSNYNLGRWLSYQKFLYHHKQLSEDKIKLLNMLHIEWKLNNKMSWSLIYSTAKQYYEEQGNLTPPFNYKTDNHYYVKGFNLYDWLVRQRSLYNRGLLSKKKIDKLNEIKMVWNLGEKNWDDMFNNLKMFLEDENSLDLSTIKKVKSWLSTQKHLYVSGELNIDRVCKLIELGINLEVNEKKTWEEAYMYAKKYYEENGNLVMPFSYTSEDGYGLGQWLYNVKKAYRAGKLDKEKTAMMEKLNIIWEKLPDEWNLYYNKAFEYYKENGSLDVNKKYVTEDGFELGKWIYNQKIRYNSKQLSSDKTKKLEQIGIEWLETKYLSWQEVFLLATKYYVEHGHLRVSEAEYEGYTLSKWIRVQRLCYKKGTLEPGKIELLNSIGMIWDISFNKYNLKEICNIFGIKYYINQKELKSISYNELYAKLSYLRDNNIQYLTEDNKLISDVFLSINLFEQLYGISSEDLMKKYDNNKVLKLNIK